MRTAAASGLYQQWAERALKALGPSSPAAVYRWIRDNEPVPATDLSGSTDDGENLFEKNVRWGRFQLSKKGIVENPTRGIWTLR